MNTAYYCNPEIIVVETVIAHPHVHSSNICVLPVVDAPGRCGNALSGWASHVSVVPGIPQLTHYESACPRRTQST